MPYTVQQLGRLAGLSPRTLRWYDEIGLLAPGEKSPAGYRLYGPAEVEKLQQILFYRALGLPLGEIRQLLHSPGFDGSAAMHRHLSALRAERARLDGLIQNAESTLRTMRGETSMNDQDRFAGFKKEKLEENERLYGKEIRESYGEERVEAANQKWLKLSESEMQKMQELETELRQTLAEAAGQQNPNEALAQRACRLHRAWLGYTWPQYSPEAHKGLAQMYEADPRFAEYYDKMAPGGTAFLCEAIRCYAGDESV